MTNEIKKTPSALEQRIEALPDFLKDKLHEWQEKHPTHEPKDVHQMIGLLETANQIVIKQFETNQSLDQIFRHITHHCPQAKNLDECHLAGAYNMAALYADTLGQTTVKVAKTRNSPFATLLRARSKTHSGR